MLINTTEQSPARLYQKQILSAGVILFLFVFFWEVTHYQGSLSWMLLVPFFLAVCFIDKTFVLPLISKPTHYYHGIFIATLLLFGPSSATFVCALSLSLHLIRLYGRFNVLVVDKLLNHVPSFLAVWLTGKMYLLTMVIGGSRGLDGLLPSIFVVTCYCLLYTFLTVSSNWMVRPVSFANEWKRHYLVPTLVFFSVAVGAGLLNYYAQRVGKEIYFLAIPFALFVLTTSKIYSVNMAESSRRLSELSQLQMSIIETLALAIDAKDHSTHGHARRVQVYAVGVAKSMGIDSRDDLEALSTAALLHDIGKLAIPEYILSKPGKLTDSEFAKMMRHVEIGANILEPIHFPYPVVPIIRYHHERYNGSGYPYGLKGDEIPLGSKILAVADTFDALTAQRTYRTPLTVSQAIELIGSESGVCFDPQIVQAFLRVATVMAEEVLALDINKYTNNTHLPPTASDTEQAHKLWLRKKGFTEIASTQREIYALHEIFQTVGKSLNLDDTLRIICTKLQSVIPFTAGVVYLKNKKTDMIHPAMVTGEYAEQLNKNWINLGEGLTGYATAFNQQVVNSDPSLDFQNLTYLERPHQLVNATIFPLAVKDNVLGAIALYSTNRESGAFTEDHVRLMETVSERAAISIQNALSFEFYEENSLTDPLTGLPNSRYMFMAYEQNVKKAERTKEKMAVLVMDLNRFKEINDQYGHKVGDEVLVKVSEVLQKEMRKYDICVRYAGDEFVAFLYNSERETAEKIADRIRRAVHSLVLKVRSGKEVRLGISIGLSMYPEDGIELTQLFTVADSQMYSDKFESKAQLARQAETQQLQEAVAVDAEIEFQRAN
jgi:diguanylate cyclase (GGDEF)-like protein/putative nucleotidyltransferase with HDIG domain